MAEITEEMWLEAKDYFERVRKIYQHKERTQDSSATFVLKMVFEPLTIRYNRGERSEQLYEEMMSIEID